MYAIATKRTYEESFGVPSIIFMLCQKAGVPYTSSSKDEVPLKPSIKWSLFVTSSTLKKVKRSRKEESTSRNEKEQQEEQQEKKGKESEEKSENE